MEKHDQSLHWARLGSNWELRFRAELPGRRFSLRTLPR